MGLTGAWWAMFPCSLALIPIWLLVPTALPPTLTHGPSPPNWLFQFLALCGASSPIIPTLSQLGSLQQAWGVEAGEGQKAPTLAARED